MLLSTLSAIRLTTWCRNGIFRKVEHRSAKIPILEKQMKILNQSIYVLLIKMNFVKKGDHGNGINFLTPRAAGGHFETTLSGRIKNNFLSRIREWYRIFAVAQKSVFRRVKNHWSAL